MNVPRVEKLIINLDTAMPLSCAWGPCEKFARTPYQIRAHEHPGRFALDGTVYEGARLCELVEASGGRIGRHYHYAFCSEGCKDLWWNPTGPNAQASIERTGRAWGNHTAGMRGTVR